MKLRKKFELFLFTVFLIFSFWLMFKSLSFDQNQNEFNIARHQVGDFGLHLALIRSFSFGNNFPAESPFYAGAPLPYHYGLDFLIGMLERLGIRVDIALNTISALAFAMLLLGIYYLAQEIFGKNVYLSLISVVFFLLGSDLGFLDYFKKNPFDINRLLNLWRIPDYLHQGSFNSSVISLFFTLNVYLNQRHLIVALAISIWLIYFFLRKIRTNSMFKIGNLMILGLLFSFTSRLHSLIFIASLFIILQLFVYFKSNKTSYYFLLFAVLFSSPHLLQIWQQKSGNAESIFFFGFLTPEPVNILNFVKFWFWNKGFALILLPLGYYLANLRQRKIFIAFFSLFLIANLFKLSFRIEHNQSILQLFFLVAGMYEAKLLTVLLNKKIYFKFLAIILIILHTSSGMINLLVIKNDYHFKVLDYPKNKVIKWIRENTNPHSIFLAKQDLYDPVALAGRKNYFGATYYLEVMGYNFRGRQLKAFDFFQASKQQTLDNMKLEKIDYLVIPAKIVPDFNYEVDQAFFNKSLQVVYQDDDTLIYKL